VAFHLPHPTAKTLGKNKENSSRMAGRFPPEPLKAIAEEVVSLLKARNETISVAETAAGGLISAALLAIPGASAVYKGGLTVRDASFVRLLYVVFRHPQNPPCGVFTSWAKSQ
jgi:hypothetical protein